MNQYSYGLTDEYRRCFGLSTSVRKAHDPGQDAYKCGRLFLHYNDAAFSKAPDVQLASPQIKKAKTYREGAKTAAQKYSMNPSIWLVDTGSPRRGKKYPLESTIGGRAGP